MAKSIKSTGIFGIDANKKRIMKDPPKKKPPKRKPKFSAGAELKNSVK
jgi:nucleoid DNA-binding protein